MLTQEIFSLQHPIVKHFIKLKENSVYRYQNDSCVLLHEKIVREWKGSIKTLLSLKAGGNGEKNYKVTPAILEKIGAFSDTIIEVALPPLSAPLQGKKLIALDQITDPGNFGTILRTAAGLGLEGAYLLEGGVDPFNDKALSAARGATFSLPLQKCSVDHFFSQIENSSHTLYFGGLHGESCHTVNWAENTILVLGHEGRGVSAQIKSIAKEVTIPLQDGVESLNVAAAAAILIYQMGQHG